MSNPPRIGWSILDLSEPSCPLCIRPEHDGRSGRKPRRLAGRNHARGPHRARPLVGADLAIRVERPVHDGGRGDGVRARQRQHPIRIRDAKCPDRRCCPCRWPCQRSRSGPSPRGGDSNVNPANAGPRPVRSASATNSTSPAAPTKFGSPNATRNTRYAFISEVDRSVDQA